MVWEFIVWGTLNSDRVGLVLPAGDPQPFSNVRTPSTLAGGYVLNIGETYSTINNGNVEYDFHPSEKHSLVMCHYSIQSEVRSA